ncbi:formyltetrahydrofolate deformylase [Paraburkholderia sp. GAS448]|uniref:formyltetrahydrofolate deformylase n=1 Tax=Paraburkholderia sp. GAS448 TaxID=3035136 RepID=UPI003D22BB12
MKLPDYVMLLSCRNQPGIVAAVTTRLFEAGFDILDSQQFDDIDSDSFFIRMHFKATDAKVSTDIEMLMAPTVKRFEMNITVQRCDQRRRVVIMASKADHCLADLLYRWRTAELQMDVVAIVSNHPGDAFSHLDLSDTAFHWLPLDERGKGHQEAEVLRIVRESEADLVILARYMQILSDSLVTALKGKCINIHHSFLPGFKGARPYHQAFERGVKLIGATAHYVTEALDEGAIIEQDVERISHRDRPEQLIRKGRDIERRVLARAVRYHLEDRVLLNGNKTIVFPG